MALSCKVPSQGELKRLDSFDLAFMTLTGHVEWMDPFDALFFAQKAVRGHGSKEYLWGPEADLLEKTLVAAWKKVGGPYVKQIQAAFDLSGDISVSDAKLKKALTRSKKLGKQMWLACGKKVRAVMETTVERSKIHFDRQRAEAIKQITEAGWEGALAAANTDHVQAYMTRYPDRILHPEVQRLADLTRMKPDARMIDKIQLRDRITKIHGRGENYFANLSDVQAGRAWTNTGIQMAHEQAVTEYMVVSEADAKVCPACRRLHGKRFPVDGAYGKMQQGMATNDPATLNNLFPFPRASQLDNKSPKQIRAMELSPPFHGKCRCDVQFLWRQVAVGELVGRGGPGVGKPLDLYMGSDVASIQHEIRAGRKEFWFTTNRKVAENYGPIVHRAQVRMRNPMILRDVVHDDELAAWVKAAKLSKHDGLIAQRVRDRGVEQVTVVAFSPKQVAVAEKLQAWVERGHLTEKRLREAIRADLKAAGISEKVIGRYAEEIEESLGYWSTSWGNKTTRAAQLGRKTTAGGEGIEAVELKIGTRAADVLEDYLAVAPSFSRDIPIYRGVGYAVAEKLKASSIGDFFDVRALSSFSSKRAIASAFGCECELGGAVIQVEGGVTYGTSIKSLSAWTEEFEVLVGKGTRFRITGQSSLTYKGEKISVIKVVEEEVKRREIAVLKEEKKAKRPGKGKILTIHEKWSDQSHDLRVVKRRKEKTV